MYKMADATPEQTMAVFFLCIILAIVMAVAFVVYFVWKKYCQKDKAKSGDVPPVSAARQNSRSMSATIDLPTSSEEATEDSDEEDSAPSTLATMYTFPDEGARCFNTLKPNTYRQGDIFAHPSSYRQNLRMFGRTLKTVEEVEEGMDSPPSYEELFPIGVGSSLLPDEDSLSYKQNGSIHRKDSLP